MLIIAAPGALTWLLVAGLLTTSLVLWVVSRRMLRTSEDLCERATHRYELMLHENDIAQTVNGLTAAMGHHQVALQQLHVAQNSTYAAVSHLISHVHAGASGQDSAPKGVILLTLFGAPFRGDA